MLMRATYTISTADAVDSAARCRQQKSRGSRRGAYC